MEKKDDENDFTFMTVEDFAKKGRSKKDLYFMFTYQRKVNCFLPPFRECTIQFLKEVLADEKKVLKIGEVIKFHMPAYPELSVEKIWKMVLKDEELIKYFPNTKPDHPPCRDFLFTILCSVRPVETKRLLDEAMKNRSIYKDRLNGEYIKVSNKWIEELRDVVNLPTTYGRSYQLLKAKTKHHFQRKKPKKYEAALDTICKIHKKKNEKFEETKEKSSLGNENMNVDLPKE